MEHYCKMGLSLQNVKRLAVVAAISSDIPAPALQLHNGLGMLKDGCGALKASEESFHDTAPDAPSALRVAD
jgi:hypothetical protein